MTSTSAKFFSSSHPGAGVLSGTAGSLQDILKSHLVDGRGAGAVESVVVASGVATATYAVGHPFVPGSVALLANAVQAGINGEHRILSTATKSVTFASPGVPDGAATGSITSKLAGAGWQELFAGVSLNVIALTSGSMESTGGVLRVDDTGDKNARVMAYESLSDIDTGLGAAPQPAQVPGGLWWPKSSAATSAARPWMLFADAAGFLLAVAPEASAGGHFTLLWAGDIHSLKSGDAYKFLLTGNQSDQTSGGDVPGGCVGYSSRTGRVGAYILRASTGVGRAVGVQRTGSHHTGPDAARYAGTEGYGVGAYPNRANNGLLVGGLEIYADGLRGIIPGLLHPFQDVAQAFVTGGVVDGTDDLAGRSLVAVRVGPPQSYSARGTVLVDATGPWVR